MINPKDKKIIKQAKESDEPIIVFRAKDILSTMVLQHYLGLVEMYAADLEFEADLVERLNEFRTWQRDNPSRVKLPD